MNSIVLCIIMKNNMYLHIWIIKKARFHIYGVTSVLTYLLALVSAPVLPSPSHSSLSFYIVNLSFKYFLINMQSRISKISDMVKQMVVWYSSSSLLGHEFSQIIPHRRRLPSLDWDRNDK